MRPGRRWLALAILVLASPLMGSGPRPASAAWQHFTQRDGLPSDHVLAIHIDRSGNTWFGTDAGAVRYDGLRWKVYTTADGLASNLVHSIFEDSTGTIWSGTSAGASLFDGERWHPFALADRLASSEVWTILKDRTGAIWFGTSYGVTRFDGAAWESFLPPDLEEHDRNPVVDILEDRGGSVWFATATRGLWRYRDGIWSHEIVPCDDEPSVSAIHEDPDGALWFGCGRCAFRYAGGVWTDLSEIRGSTSSIAEDRWHRLWFAGTDVQRYDGWTWRSFIDAFGSAVVAADPDGAVWFGGFGGVLRFDGSSALHFTAADGLGSSTTYEVVEDRERRIWVGTSGGVSRYDGSQWVTLTTLDGLAENTVVSILADSSGVMWFGTFGGGLSRYDGNGWTTYSTLDGLASNYVTDIHRDRHGTLWVGTTEGLSRFDGSVWTTFREPDGLAANHVTAILEDRNGVLWFATVPGVGLPTGGVSRYDGTTWRTFRAADGLPSNWVTGILEDSSGALWFATYDAGVARFDGTRWEVFTGLDGLASDEIKSMVEDREGALWFATSRGITRFAHGAWRTFAADDGLPTQWLGTLHEDRRGSLWITTLDGVVEFERDRVAPRPVFLATAPALSGARDAVFSCVAGFGESRGIQYSSRLDSGPASLPSPIASWRYSGVGDGIHTVEVTATDLDRNASTARTTFEVDATPPAPIISSPTTGQAVSGQITIRGTADDPRFRSYRLEFRPENGSTWTTLHDGLTPANDGELGGWNTSGVDDGEYTLRLRVFDTLDLTGFAQAQLVVDNEAPRADETAPAWVPAGRGGNVYTTRGEAHLYFPPGAFDDRTQVSIATDSVASPPAAGPPVGSGYRIGWNAPLRKPAVLEVSGAGSSSRALAIYRTVAGTATEWRRVGGTPSPDGRSLSAAVTDSGLYVVIAELVPPGGTGTLSEVSLTPRIFSGRERSIAIGFSLGRAGSVTVGIYNRAGRLVRALSEGAPMGAGANVVRWDGRDRNGAESEDGLYLVSIEALGERRTRALAVIK